MMNKMLIESTFNVQKRRKMSPKRNVKEKKRKCFAGKRVLCRIKLEYTDCIVYRDGTWRYDEENFVRGWHIVHSESFGPIFLYKNEGDDFWQTDWTSNDEKEAKIANSIVKALGDLAVEEMLTDNLSDSSTEATIS